MHLKGVSQLSRCFNLFWIYIFVFISLDLWFTTFHFSHHPHVMTMDGADLWKCTASVEFIVSAYFREVRKVESIKIWRQKSTSKGKSAQRRKKWQGTLEEMRIPTEPVKRAIICMMSSRTCLHITHPILLTYNLEPETRKLQGCRGPFKKTRLSHG